MKGGPKLSPMPSLHRPLQILVLPKWKKTNNLKLGKPKSSVQGNKNIFEQPIYCSELIICPIKMSSKIENSCLYQLPRKQCFKRTYIRVYVYIYRLCASRGAFQHLFTTSKT